MDANDLLSALRKPEQPLVAQLSELVVDQVLAQPMANFLDAETIVTVASGLASRDHLARALERHGRAAAARIQAQLSASGERLEDALPEATRAALVERLSAPTGPRLRWLAGALDRTLLRELLAPVLQEVLLAFVGRLRSTLGIASSDATTAAGPGPGPRGGLFGRFGKDVGLGTGRRVLEVGRTMMGGLGLDLEERIQALAKEFSGAASEAYQEALQRRLASEEGRALMRELAERGLAHVLSVPVAEVLEDLDRIPLGTLLEMLPDVWSHNALRPLGQELMEREAEAWLAGEGQMSLDAWLRTANVLSPIRTLAVRHTTEQLRVLIGAPGFEAWLSALVDAARA